MAARSLGSGTISFGLVSIPNAARQTKGLKSDPGWRTALVARLKDCPGIVGHPRGTNLARGRLDRDHGSLHPARELRPLPLDLSDSVTNGILGHRLEGQVQCRVLLKTFPAVPVGLTGSSIEPLPPRDASRCRP